MTPNQPTRYVMAWAAWGTYHHARFAAFRQACIDEGVDAVGLDVFASGGDYGWRPSEAAGVERLGLQGSEFAFPGARRIWPAARRVWQLAPTVMFVPGYNGWSLALTLVARARGAQMVVMSETHGDTARSGRLRRSARLLAVRTAGAMLVGGARSSRYFRSLGVPASRMFLGYDAVDSDAFARAGAKARRQPTAVLEALGLPQRFILAVARFVPKKSLETLIVAYSIVRARLGSDAPSLVLIGDGSLRSSLERLATDLDVPIGSDGLQFVRSWAPDDVARVIGLAECLVLPSVLEEWGLVVNEAMAAGCPVVVSRAVGCVDDLIDDRRTGLLFEPGDFGELADKLLELVESPELRAELVMRARERIGLWGCDRFAEGALAAARVAQTRAPWPRLRGWLSRR